MDVDVYHGHVGSVTAKLHVVSSPSTSLASSTTSTKRIDIPSAASRTKYYVPMLTPSSSPNVGGVLMKGATIASALNGVLTPPNTPPDVASVMTSPIGRISSSSGIGASPLLAKLFPASADDAALIGNTKSIVVQSYQPDGSSVLWDGFVLKTAPPTPSSSSNRHRRTASSQGPPSPTRSALKGSRAAQAAIAASAMGAIPKTTLYMSAQSAFSMYDRVRETVVALLDLASEHLGCDAVVMVLDRSYVDEGTGAGAGIEGRVAKREFEELLHSLMYVGGSVVTRPPFPVDPRLVLIGIEV